MNKRKYKLKKVLVISYDSKLSCYRLSWKYKSRKSKHRTLFLGSKDDVLRIARQLIELGFAEGVIIK
ncbi:hypothetical protein DRN69_05060 [Candidatus Pacearchaeota archaeon]|nr:MAG: hypothetical protein DRN69_05060 [Candidatus Pacearchaeota archaeon]